MLRPHTVPQLYRRTLHFSTALDHAAPGYRAASKRWTSHSHSQRTNATRPPIIKPEHHNQRTLRSTVTMSSAATTSSPSTSPPLVRFFDPTIHAKDARGRTLPSIIAWPDTDLESNHDYIQTIFPLPESSMFANAPIVTQEIYDHFHKREDLRASLGKAFERILEFYGLKLDGEREELKVVRGENWAKNSRNWVTRFDHNHLRMTRILRSLRVLGLPAQAKAFHGFLSTDPDVAKSVSSKSQMYWRRATERPLHLPPDEDDEAAQGVPWLRGLEG